MNPKYLSIFDTSAERLATDSGGIRLHGGRIVAEPAAETVGWSELAEMRVCPCRKNCRTAGKERGETVVAANLPLGYEVFAAARTSGTTQSTSESFVR